MNLLFLFGSNIMVIRANVTGEDMVPLVVVFHTYLEGQGDLVSRLFMGISRVTIWVIGVINLLTKSP